VHARAALATPQRERRKVPDHVDTLDPLTYVFLYWGGVLDAPKRSNPRALRRVETNAGKGSSVV